MISQIFTRSLFWLNVKWWRGLSAGINPGNSFFRREARKDMAAISSNYGYNRHILKSSNAVFYFYLCTSPLGAWLWSNSSTVGGSIGGRRPNLLGSSSLLVLLGWHETRLCYGSLSVRGVTVCFVALESVKAVSLWLFVINFLVSGGKTWTKQKTQTGKYGKVTL